MRRIVQILEKIDSRLEAILHILNQENSRVPENSLAKRKRAENGVNKRLLMFLLKNPEAQHWSATKLASSLQCSKTAIIESQTWKTMMSHPKTKTKRGIPMEQIEDYRQEPTDFPSD